MDGSGGGGGGGLAPLASATEEEAGEVESTTWGEKREGWLRRWRWEKAVGGLGASRVVVAVGAAGLRAFPHPGRRVSPAWWGVPWKRSWHWGNFPSFSDICVGVDLGGGAVRDGLRVLLRYWRMIRRLPSATMRSVNRDGLLPAWTRWGES